MENNYDEFGEVIVAAGAFDAANYLHLEEYQRIVAETSPMQTTFLVLSIFTCVGLLAYIVYLRKKLFYRVPWKPPKSVNSPGMSGAVMHDARLEAGRMSRINSGIMAMRSRSHTGTDSHYSQFS